jgi:hypothetical protein
MNLTIEINLATTDPVDLVALKRRIADNLRKLANPVRQDQGILTISNVRIVTDPHVLPESPSGDDYVIAWVEYGPLRGNNRPTDESEKFWEVISGEDQMAIRVDELLVAGVDNEDLVVGELSTALNLD